MKKWIGMKLVRLGTWLNYKVVDANGGQMPVSLHQWYDGIGPQFRHKKMTPDCKYKVLGDIFVFPTNGMSFSLGDVLLSIGTTLIAPSIFDISEAFAYVDRHNDESKAFKKLSFYHRRAEDARAKAAIKELINSLGGPVKKGRRRR